MAGTIPETSAYTGETLALLTKHGKGKAVSAALQPHLDCRVITVDGFDTDRLGTFTREVPRPHGQRETAFRKAHIARRLAGGHLGLGSEGAFGADPMTGLLPWNRELVVLCDEQRGIEVAGLAEGEACFHHCLTDNWEQVITFLEKAGFPEHQLALRPESDSDPRIRKGINSLDALEAAFHAARAEADNGMVFLENDLRAHANPTRMAMIRKAAENLAEKLLSHCPRCDSPGFWLHNPVRGLPCEQCGLKTPEPLAWEELCHSCQFRRRLPEQRQWAPARLCPVCNP